MSDIVPTRRRTYIRERRQAAGLTLQQLAEAIGKSIGTLSEIERDVTGYTPETLEAIAGALNLPISKLFEPPEPGPEAEIINLMRRIPKQDQLAARRAVRGVLREFLPENDASEASSK